MNPQTLLLLFLTFYFLEICCRVCLSALNSRHLLKIKENPPARYKNILDSERYQESLDYVILRARYKRISNILATLVFLIFVYFRGFQFLESWSRSLTTNTYLSGILYIYATSFCLSITPLLVTNFPRFFSQKKLASFEGKFSFKNATLGLILLILIATPLLFLLLFFFNKTGTYWWLYAFSILLFFRLYRHCSSMIFAPPNVTALESESLKQKISEFTKKVSFSHLGVFVQSGSPTTKALGHHSCFFTGFGENKRIIISQGILQTLEEDQVLALLAHDLKHEQAHHPFKSILFKTFFSFAFLYFFGKLVAYPTFYEAFHLPFPSTASAFLLISLSFSPISFLLAPIFSFWNRKQEYKADTYAAQFTQSEDLVKALLTLENLFSKSVAESSHLGVKDQLLNLWPHPWYSFFYNSYPTTPERIAQIEARSAAL